MNRLTFIQVTDPEDGDLWQLQLGFNKLIIWVLFGKFVRYQPQQA